MSEIRDAIYGFIKPNDKEWKIINTLLFQRLRKIKQLACAYLVYPCAMHTRFEHSLGVYHLASKMAEKLLEAPDKREFIRIAALLHDVGHGPFSHVSEQILEQFSVLDDKTEKIHEKITRRLIESDNNLKDLLGKDTISEVLGLLDGTKMDYSIMKEIISGPIDADKQDYLLRDSYFCGVKYGIYDYERLINTIEPYKESGDIFISVNEDGIHTLEQFILAKYYMTRQVYRHRIRLITDQMLIRGIELGITKDENKTLGLIYSYKDDESFINNYIKWWDDKLLNYLIFDTETGYAHEIFKMLYERRLFKQVFSIRLQDYEEIGGSARTILQSITKKEMKKLKTKLEVKIASIIGSKPEYTIINSFLVKSVRELAKDNDEQGKIIIQKNDGTKKDFEIESAIFRSIDESLKESWLEIYAKVDFADNRDKEKKKREWKINIIDCLKELEKEEIKNGS